MKTVYDFSVKLPGGGLQSLQKYAGKPLLIVNTASKCGFTPQFKELQELYDEYKDQGLVILGFPCDQFRNQEFEDIGETMEFCKLNYGVTFPMFAKIDVNGEAEDPLYTFLKDQQKGFLFKRIKWNFTKFLVNRRGQVMKRYAPTTPPSKIKEDILEVLSIS